MKSFKEWLHEGALLRFGKYNSAKEVKAALEKKYPKSKGWSFSVSEERGSVPSLKVTILTAPIQFIPDGKTQRVYHQHDEILKKHNEIQDIFELVGGLVTTGDDRDVSTDFFANRFYLELRIGANGGSRHDGFLKTE